MDKNNTSFKHSVYFRYVNSKCSNDMYVVEYGYENFKISNQKLTPRIQSDYIFHFVFSGKGTLVLKNKEFSISKNQMFYIPSGQIMNYYPDKKEPWKYCWIAFNGIHARNYCYRLSLSLDNPVCCFNNVTEIKKIFDDLFLIDEDTTSGDLYALSAIYKLFAVLLSEKDPKTQVYTQKERYINDVINYIENNYSSPTLKVEDISKALSLSHVYLCKLFQEIMGTTMVKYLIGFRMMKAAEIISKQNLSMKTVAKMVGYEDQMHFSKAFKSRFGISPSFYKATP